MLKWRAPLRSRAGRAGVRILYDRSQRRLSAAFIRLLLLPLEYPPVPPSHAAPSPLGAWRGVRGELGLLDYLTLFTFARKRKFRRKRRA